MVMRKKRLIIVVAFIMSIGIAFSSSAACCSGEITLCWSDADAFAADFFENCECGSVLVNYIECD